MVTGEQAYPAFFLPHMQPSQWHIQLSIVYQKRTSRAHTHWTKCPCSVYCDFHDTMSCPHTGHIVVSTDRIVDCLCSTVHVVWVLHITQRTHAIQCHCMSEGSVLGYMYSSTKCKSGKTHNSSSHGRTSASTTAAWAHLRALRDTGNTCHGTPDLGEGPSGAHASTTCPWNAKRRRQDYYTVGVLRGNKQAIKQTHRMHAEL